MCSWIAEYPLTRGAACLLFVSLCCMLYHRAFQVFLKTLLHQPKVPMGMTWPTLQLALRITGDPGPLSVQPQTGLDRLLVLAGRCDDPVNFAAAQLLMALLRRMPGEAWGEGCRAAGGADDGAAPAAASACLRDQAGSLLHSTALVHKKRSEKRWGCDRMPAALPAVHCRRWQLLHCRAQAGCWCRRVLGRCGSAGGPGLPPIAAAGAGLLLQCISRRASLATAGQAA